MIDKLRFRLILASMLAFFIVLAAIMAGVNIWSYRGVVSEADRVLDMLADNGGSFPEPDRRMDMRPDFGRENDFELRFEIRRWWVLLDGDGEVLGVNLDMIAAVDEDTAAEYASRALASGRERGFIGDYRYLVRSEDGGSRVSFVDCARTLGSFRTFLIASVAVSAAGLLVVLALIILFSGRIVRPISESYEKQKEFITNAGHEIKTPIAIINADTEVLELDTGENEFIDDIRKQTKRLAGLTNDLILLTKMEEPGSLSMIEFPFSDMVTEAAESFKNLAAAEKKGFTCEVEPGLEVKGDEERIRQLVNILLDNAVKYCPEGGGVSVRAEKHRSGVRLTVENTAEGVTDEQLRHMFDRFYRGDKSRSTPGHGLGLSIAKAVTEAHKGTITAQTGDGKSVRMTVTL